jgi:hypothetical protein
MIFVVSASALAQNSTPTFKAETESAIVWSGPQCKQSYTTMGGHELLCEGIADTAHPDASSLVQDPLTGDLLRKISYQGVEVTSRLASYEVGWNRTAYVATLTIVNNTEYPLHMDGSTFTSTLRPPTQKEIRKWWGKKANPAEFVPSSGSIPPGQSASISGFMVSDAQGSNLTRWFNHTPVDVVPLRYSIKLRGKDFVFPWLAPVNRTLKTVPQWDY